MLSLDPSSNYTQNNSELPLDFICELCSKKFTQETSLRAHKLTHEIKLYNSQLRFDFICELCPEKFTRETSLRAHFLTHKNRINKLGNLKTSTSEILPLVDCLFSQRNRIFYPKDPEKSTQEVSLSDHVVSHKNHLHKPDYSENFLHETSASSYILPYTNRIPQLDYPSNFTIKTHISDYGLPYKDGISEISKSDLKNEFACRFCPKKCTRSSSLKSHLRIHKDKIAEETIFPLDPSTYVNMKANELKFDFTCFLCPEKFTRETSLRAHILTHKNLNSRRQELSRDSLFNLNTGTCNTKQKHPNLRFDFICQLCPEKFTLESSLKAHSLTHKEWEPNICEICNKVFTNQLNLSRHYQIHAEKQYKCELCSITFRLKSDLTEHLLTHIQEKFHQSHICDVCHESFKTKTTLYYHNLTHLSRVVLRSSKAICKK